MKSFFVALNVYVVKLLGNVSVHNKIYCKFKFEFLMFCVFK